MKNKLRLIKTDEYKCLCGGKIVFLNLGAFCEACSGYVPPDFSDEKRKEIFRKLNFGSEGENE